MYDNSRLLDGLREAIFALLTEKPSPRHINCLIAKCHALALAALHMKRRHKLMLIEDTLNLSDVAYDCIGELFARNGEGTLVRLKTYFESFDFESSTDEDLLIQLRRLVFSSVNQGLFRIYSSYDPSLGKILRNVKISMQALAVFTEVNRLGEQCLVPVACDPLSHLPPINLETLQSVLSVRTPGSERIPSILAVLARYLREQSEYSREVPIVRLALAIRWLYAAKQLPPSGSTSAAELDHHIDVAAAIRYSCQNTLQTLGANYLREGRLSQDLLDSYLKAVEMYLLAEFDGVEGEGSLFESLKTLVPELSRRDYMEIHRSRLEYLARDARASVLERLKDA
jgi:hypothetical protein